MFLNHKLFNILIVSLKIQRFSSLKKCLAITIKLNSGAAAQIGISNTSISVWMTNML